MGSCGNPRERPRLTANPAKARRSNYFSRVITDIGLPGLNGRQLADAARINRPNLKILFMTGYAETAAAKSFLAHGMEIITKPFDMDALADRVRDIIEGKTRTPS